jgi:hypothetical protein
MSIDKSLFGEIFISHSSVDKPFARKLAHGIEKADFRTWLDEKQLLPGDPHPPGADTRFGVKTRRWTGHAGYQHGEHVVTVDFSNMKSHQCPKRLLQQAKTQLLKRADDLAKNERDVKWLLK